VRFMFAPLSNFIDRVGQLLQGPTMDRTIFKRVPWDVWAALAVAAMVLILAAFNQSPLLKFVLVGLVLWAYIAIQNRPRYRD
jgi:type IV secretory pathway VirB3-like protein